MRSRGTLYRVPTSMVRLRNDWPSLVLALIGILGVLGLAIGFGVKFGFVNEDLHGLWKGQEPIGFYAFKRTTQSIPMSVFTTVTGWSVGGGSPSYDASNGAFNLLTGVWTTQIPGKYQVSASVCWTSGALGLRQLIILTSGNPLATPVSSNLGLGLVTCNSLSVAMQLDVGVTVQAQALRGTAGVEVISTASVFSIERILGDS